jgi:hypothetical protein
MTFLATYKSEGFVPGGLIAGNAALLISEPIVLLAGQNLTRGALLGKITATGKYVLSLDAATDGSEVPAAILVEDTDATDADAPTVAYIRGDFLTGGVTFGTGHTAASVKDALRDQGIFLIDQIPV